MLTYDFLAYFFLRLWVLEKIVIFTFYPPFPTLLKFQCSRVRVQYSMLNWDFKFKMLKYSLCTLVDCVMGTWFAHIIFPCVSIIQWLRCVSRSGCLDSQKLRVCEAQLVLAWPQLINIQVFRNSVVSFRLTASGGSVYCCVASGLFLCFTKLAQFSEKVGFAWGQAFGSVGSERFRQSCRDSREERTRPEAIECYTVSEVWRWGIEYNRLYECYEGRERGSGTLILPESSARRKSSRRAVVLAEK